MRKALLHPVSCLLICLFGIYLMRQTFGLPGAPLWVGLFLAGCGFVCNLALIPWICFSDWGRMMWQKKTFDEEVMKDRNYLMFLSFMSWYVLAAIIGTVASIWVGPATVAGAGAVILAASATFAAWQVMRWSPNPT